MFDYVAGHPEGVTVWQILDAVYADDPNGGPSKHNIVSVMKFGINQKLKKLGISARIVATGGGAGSIYRLVEG
jgi:UDP-N-acetylglucosamine transferase subunit ALG13